MTLAVFHKLLAIFLTVGLGWIVGRMRWLGGAGGPTDAARVLGNAAFYIFVPALLFRTVVRLDFATMPWHTLSAFFVPVLMVLIAVYLWQRGSGERHGAAAPSVRAVAGVFGNSVQVGIPVAAALFGEPGLAIHIALISLHAIVLLTVLTVLAEMDVARARARQEAAPSLARTLASMLRNTIVHPVVLPVIAGMIWNATGLGLHPVVDEVLAGLGSAVVPVCLVLIGVSLASYGLRGGLRQALGVTALKLMVLPALVLAVAWGVFGLTGTPLAVLVMMAALPVGSNALIFAQRYDTLQAEATVAIVVSTVGFIATAALWLAILAALGS